MDARFGFRVEGIRFEAELECAMMDVGMVRVGVYAHLECCRP